MEYIKHVINHTTKDGIIQLNLSEMFVIKDSQKAAIIRVALKEFKKKLILAGDTELKQLTQKIIDKIDIKNAQIKVVDVKELIK